jgi:4-amino-4-deoxy-L-arabinose transferase-like glycosyltransferase
MLNPRERRRDLGYAAALFVAVSSLYYATLSGITCSNDGSHYALVRAIAEHGRAEISEFSEYTQDNDVAKVGALLYSDRPPGTALLTVPMYWLGRMLTVSPRVLPSRHDADNPALIYALLVPVWLGAGTVVLLFLWLRRAQVSAEAACAAALAFALGTIQWKYSSVLFSHAASGFAVFAAFALLTQSERATRVEPRLAALLGFTLGASVGIEYSNLLYLLLAAGFLWLRRDRLRELRGAAPSLAAFALGALVPLAALMTYNSLLFGGPLHTSYSASATYPWAGSLAETFSQPIRLGVPTLLFLPHAQPMLTTQGSMLVIGVMNQGVFWLSPVLLFALPGLYLGWRREPRLVSLAVATFASYVLLFAMHRTPHGFTRDGRYLAPFLPFLALGLGFFLNALFARPIDGARRLALQLGFWALLMLSIRNVALHIALSYNYRFQWGRLIPIAADPWNLRFLLESLLPNARDLPRLWLLEAVALVPVLLLLARRHPEPAEDIRPSRKKRRPT